MTGTESVLAVRGLSRRLIGRMMQNHWIFLFGLLPLMVWTTLTLISPTRTIQLEARTLSIEIQMNGGPQSWKMNGAVICLPSQDFRKSALAPCGDGQEMRERKSDGVDIVDWPPNQKLQLIWSKSGLRVIMKSEDPFQYTENEYWPKWTELHLTSKQALENGALSFSGRAVLGEQMRTGATGYILDGFYFIFERSVSGAIFDLSPDITRSGELRRGDEIEVICRNNFWHSCDGEPIGNTSGRYVNSVSGSISMDNDGRSGLQFVGLGEEANSLLKVSSAGRDEALEVKPNWLQRAAKSSSLIAISLILALWAPLLLAVLDRYKKN